MDAKKIISEDFPLGYGDFIMQSSDGVIFHFPKAILSYMSPVFEDMFKLATSEQGTSLIISENSQAWGLFLNHIDPKRQIPAFNFETISSISECAEKYRVSTIMKWFDNEVA